MSEKYIAKAGEHISSAAKNAIKKAKKNQILIILEFNGYRIPVNPNSYYGDICLIYDLKQRIFYATVNESSCHG